MAVPGPVEQSVSNFVDNGLYPEDEALITAELPSATLESLSKLLDNARSDVKTSIRELSRLSAPDIDGWIIQAKQLKADVKSSVVQADGIEELGQENTKLLEQTADAASKVKLLHGEVAFNQTLTESLESIASVRALVEKTALAVNNDALSEAQSGLRSARARLDSLGSFQTTLVARMLSDNLAELALRFERRLDLHWEKLVHLDKSSPSITISAQSGNVSLDSVAAALSELGLLRPKVIELCKQLDVCIIEPRLRKETGTGTFSVHGDSLSLSPEPSSVKELLTAEVMSLRNYLRAHFPNVVDSDVSPILIPNLIEKLLSGPLPASVPADLGGISGFQETLQDVSRLAQELQSSGHEDTSELTAWVDDAPEVWLQGRRSESLDSMRQLLKRGLGNPRSVERVETQTVIESDEVFGRTEGNDDWDNDWGDEEEHQPTANPEPVNIVAEGDEDDSHAWGWDEEAEHDTAGDEGGAAQPTEPGDEAEAEAWGWGDDEKNEQPVAEHEPSSRGRVDAAANWQRPGRTNGNSTQPATERTVTLREAYHISALPESVLELIVMVVEDADGLERNTTSPVAPAADGLASLASLLLAMYRANAPETYSAHESGNMFLYNDILYLAEQLKLFTGHRASRQSGAGLDLDKDITILESFGKRAYSKEMESQRVILTDLLDGAEGFVSCTDPLRAGQCDLAVSSVIDRIHQVHEQWSNVLSPGALLQSTGALLNTIVSKIILDIEDISDIQESESQALTAYFSSVESLDDLFLRSREGDGENSVPLTAGYVPNWLKFQYLANILDSSLVDIKYLWTEGSLSLEFSPEEVVDLIEALFADSPRRKEAISEIRRSAR